VSFAVIKWIDVFEREDYKKIIIDALHFSQFNKGMEIFAWCIMTNHIHLIFRSINGIRPELLLGDFKRFTSKKIVEAIMNNPAEKRSAWLLEQFKEAADNSSNVKNFQFWQHDNHPIELWSNKVIQEKLNYIHNNPVEAGFVVRPEEYIYSSARDYSGIKGLLEGIVLV